MANVQITCALDATTAKGVSRLAKRWQTSPSEVLRRLTKEALKKPVLVRPKPRDELAAKRMASLEALSASLQQRGVDVTSWTNAVRETRR